VVIDMVAAALRDEQALIEYAKALKEHHPKVKAFLAKTETSNG